MQFFNAARAGSDDAFFDASLIEMTGTGGPTPGRQNSVFAADAPPAMRQVDAATAAAACEQAGDDHCRR